MVKYAIKILERDAPPSLEGSKSAKSVTLVICTVVETDEGPVGWGVGAAFTRGWWVGVVLLDATRDRL